MTIALSKSSAFVDAINVKNPTYGAVGNGSTDDTAALQAAINAAITAGKPLYIPVGLYKYTPPLTVSGNLSIVGAWVAGNWASGNINVPTGTPPLIGAVLYPASNGQDAISLSNASISLNLRDIGILFQTPFVGTGDGIHYIPGSTDPGLTDFRWDNVMVYGHDGDHYAANLQNPILGLVSKFFTYGGGAMKLHGTHASRNFGNMTVSQLMGQVIVGGSAHGVMLSASRAQCLNLIVFVRPQTLVNNQSGVTPVGNTPTTAQNMWNEDGNVTNIRKIGADWETNISANLVLGGAQYGNDNDWPGIFTNPGTISSPAWGAKGILGGIQTRNFIDTTSSGAVGDTAMFSLPASQISASSATTYAVLATLYVQPPTQGSNVTATKLRAIYANGAIETSSSLSCAGSLTANGTSSLIGNVGIGKSTSTTAIGAIAAGTTAKAQLNFASGVAPTSPQNGDVWFDGTNIKMQIGGATKTFTLT
jgi:hypothetical protein